MTLVVHTARTSIRDPDAFDITAKSGVRAFAPSWTLLGPYLEKRRRGTLMDNDWTDYVLAYTAEMRLSYVQNTQSWSDLLSRPRVVLTCYCTDPARCHRTVLAGILRKLGAACAGELAP
jgi:uncharacterized protein YeaO (DUF488 family)